MKIKFLSAITYCALGLAMALVATSCKNDTPPQDDTHGPGGDKTKDTVAALSLFSADSIALSEALSFDIQAATQNLIVDANVKGWTVQIQGNTAGEAPWLICEPALGPVGRTEVTLAVTANQVETPREGIVTFLQDSTGLTKQIKVTQKEAPAMETDILSDSMALIAIYNAWDGKGLWKDMWDLKKPLDKWTGVTVSLVDGKRRVTALNFESKSAKGDIPAELGNLRALTSLTLVVSNRVKGAIPNSLSFAKGMTTLYLRGSVSITGIPKDIGQWTELETLDFEGTSVTELPESLSQCSKLKYFNATQLSEKAPQKLAGNITKSFANKPELLVLKLGVTDLKGDLSFLKEAPKMTNMEIEGAMLSGDLNLAAHLSHRSDSLRFLSLGSNPQLTGTLAGLNQLPNLESFSLIDSQVAGTLDDMQLHTMPSISSVTLTNNQITGTISVDFVNALKTTSDVGMNKLEGTLAPEVVEQLFAKFMYDEKVCVQKEGFGFTNCTITIPEPK